MKPDVLEGLPENIVKLFWELEERTMLDVVRRLRNNGNGIIRSADWQMYRLNELGETDAQIRKYIKDALELTDAELDSIYDKVIADGFSHDNSIYLGLDVSDDDGLSQLIDGIRQQTDNEFSNITQTTGFAIDKNGKISYSSVTDVLDGAMMDISSGLFDYNTVLKRVVNQMTNSGLRTVDYASGWSNRVDVAARRAVMTGVSQLTGKINESNAEKLGTDTYEVSWHSGARPSHLEWQGKWYTMQELRDICGLGTVTGLCGANCYHSYTPVIPGISEPVYSAEQLEQMKREELTPKEYSGKKYTKYEALQKQRRMETAMRAQRQKIKLLEEGGADEDDIISARCRYRGTSAEYARFSNAMDLPEQLDRVYIDGLGAVGKGKYTKKVLKTESDNDIIHSKGTINKSVHSQSNKQSFSRTHNEQVFRDGSNAFSEEAKTKLYQCERIIAGNKYESAIIYDKNGNMVFKKKGNANSVSFTVEESKKMKGCVLTHNHPDGSVFSPEDINMLRVGDLSEIRACNKNGTFILRRCDKWHKDISDLKKLDEKYWQAMNEVGDKYRDKAAQEGRSILFYLNDIDKDGMQLFCDRYGFEFIWEEC